MNPTVILLFSGKRKCGKDFITDHLQANLGDKCEVIKISLPIKSYWAKDMNLNLNELLSDGTLKESYRLDMINWSEKMRAQDYGCFCRVACQNANVREIWIVSDVRRETDMQWFYENYGTKIKSIRLVADDDTRRERGYQFQTGVDDVDSECGLDNYNSWDLVINNGKGRESIEKQLEKILSLIP